MTILTDEAKNDGMIDGGVAQEMQIQVQQPKILCGLCGKNYHQYVCPKCDIAYCSLYCYKSEIHSKCSESFYQNEFCENLRGTKVDNPNERRKIEEIIRRINVEDDGYEENSDSSIDTEKELELRKALKDLDTGSDTQALLNLLSNRQKNELAEITSGKKDCLSLVGISKPWWVDADVDYIERGELKINPNDAHLVEAHCFMNINDEFMSEELKKVYFYAKKKIEQLETSDNVSMFIGCQKDSEPLLNNIIEIVSAYVYCHLYMGNDLVNSLGDAAEMMHSLSCVLRPRARVKYSSPLEAWASFCENMNKHEARYTPHENLRAIIASLLTIISYRKKVLRVLTDIYGLFLSVSKINTTKKETFMLQKEIALKTKFYYCFYRDNRDTNEWSQYSISSLLIKREEYSFDLK